MTTKSIYGVSANAALRIMDSSEFEWKKCRKFRGDYRIRPAMAAKAAAVVAHDRALCGELPSRGVPSYLGSGSNGE